MPEVGKDVASAPNRALELDLVGSITEILDVLQRVGNGDLGYCTKMCNSWSDCPSHWECKRPGNAPQRICMQDNW